MNERDPAPGLSLRFVRSHRNWRRGIRLDRGREVQIPSGGKLKGETLAEVGISTSTANRYEELAAPEEQS